MFFSVPANPESVSGRVLEEEGRWVTMFRVSIHFLINFIYVGDESGVYRWSALPPGQLIIGNINLFVSSEHGSSQLSFGFPFLGHDHQFIHIENQ